MNERQTRALVAHIEAHGGVSVHGNTARALERRGYATSLGEAFGGGTTFRLTDEGRRVALRLAAAEYRNRAEKARRNRNIERARQHEQTAAKYDERASALEAA